MVTVSGSIVIDHPAADVFAFVSDYENDPRWRGGVLEMRQVPRGAARVGIRTREVVRLMGRVMVTEAEAVAYDPGHRIAFRTVSGALTAEGFRRVEPHGTRTRSTYHAKAQLDPVYRPFAALITLVYNRRVARDLARLRALLESAA